MPPSPDSTSHNVHEHIWVWAQPLRQKQLKSGPGTKEWEEEEDDVNSRGVWNRKRVKPLSWPLTPVDNIPTPPLPIPAAVWSPPSLPGSVSHTGFLYESSSMNPTALCSSCTNWSAETSVLLCHGLGVAPFMSNIDQFTGEKINKIRSIRILIWTSASTAAVEASKHSALTKWFTKFNYKPESLTVWSLDGLAWNSENSCSGLSKCLGSMGFVYWLILWTDDPPPQQQSPSRDDNLKMLILLTVVKWK